MIQTLRSLCSLALFAFSDGLCRGVGLSHTEDGWKRLVAWSTSMLFFWEHVRKRLLLFRASFVETPSFF